MSEFESRELEIHDPFVLPSELELEAEIERPRWWYAQQLRLAGASWDEIAKALGYQSGPSAHATVKARTSKEMARQSAQELMELDLERLDQLQLVVWRRARQGDDKAIETVLKIMNTRAKYLGLDKGVSYEDETTSKATILIGGDTEDYLAAVKEAQLIHRSPIEGSVATSE